MKILATTGRPGYLVLDVVDALGLKERQLLTSAEILDHSTLLLEVDVVHVPHQLPHGDDRDLDLHDVPVQVQSNTFNRSLGLDPTEAANYFP